jgi:hypothetical protein
MIEGLENSRSFKINKLNLYTSDGQFLDIRGLMLELDIFEDIFSPCMTGSITLADGLDLLSSFKIHGNEFLEIEIDKPSLEQPIKKVFRVYKVSDRAFGTNLQNYTIYFCSEELLLSQLLIISKSYRGIKISEIIRDILQNYLQVNPKKLNAFFQSTERAFDIIIPRLDPLEAIMWLLGKAYATNDSLFFFYENREGYNLVSYETLLKQPIFEKYYKDFKVTDEPIGNMQSFNMLSIKEDFDTIKSMRYGAFSSTYNSLDLATKTFKSDIYNSTGLKQKGILNKEVTMNLFENRLGSNFYNSFDGMIKYGLVSDSELLRNPMLPEEWLAPTASRLAQLQGFKMIGTIPGDILMRAGNIIEVELPKIVPQDKIPEKNSTRTGKYLVSSVHHRFIADQFVCIIEMLSDSISEFMPAPNNSSSKLRELAKS